MQISEKFGSKPTQIIQQISLGGFIDQEKRFFLPNFVLFKIPLTCLTNSALSTTQVTRSTLKGPRDLKM